MTNPCNGKKIVTRAKRLAIKAIAIAPESMPLRDGAAWVSIAPNSFSGCVSEISSHAIIAANAINKRDHDYSDAMKNYGAVYENYQAYLMPAEHALPHDYDAAAKFFPDFSHLGCLNADLFGVAISQVDVSDDDIESCGYLGWVRH